MEDENVAEGSIGEADVLEDDAGDFEDELEESDTLEDEGDFEDDLGDTETAEVDSAEDDDSLFEEEDADDIEEETDTEVVNLSNTGARMTFSGKTEYILRLPCK